jgi:hypothetical protein
MKGPRSNPIGWVDKFGPGLEWLSVSPATALKSVKPNLKDFKQHVDVRLILPGGDLGRFEIYDAGSTDWQGNRCNSRNTAVCGPEGLKMCLAGGSV